MAHAVDELRRLAALLCSDPVTIDDVVGHLGAATGEAGGAVTVRPDGKALARAVVVPRWGTVAPAHVRIDLAEPTTLDELRRHFGASLDVAPDDEGPRQSLFEIDLQGEPYTVAVLAEHGAAGVCRLTLRRDVRL